MVATFGNTGFLGYPITLALLPHMFTAAILVDQIGMSVILYPSSPIIGSIFGDAEKPNHRPPAFHKKTPHNQMIAKRFRPSDRTLNALAFFRSPLFVAMVIGGAVRAMPWPDAITQSQAMQPAGKVVVKCLDYLGQGTIPLIMLSMGASLRPRSAHASIGPILLASGFKLLLAPLAMWVFLRGVGVSGQVLTAGVMLAGMPTSVMSSVLSKHHDMDGDFAVGVVFITTVLSALTIPMWITLTGH
jgi:predicted permease